jgi:hypothetical protein
VTLFSLNNSREATLEDLKTYFELLISTKHKSVKRGEEETPDFYRNILKTEGYDSIKTSAEFFFSRSSLLLSSSPPQQQSSSSSEIYPDLSEDEDDDTYPFPYMIFMNNERPGEYSVEFESAMYVRKCYIHAANNLCNLFLVQKDGSETIVLSIFGSSGTGKSGFGFYLMRRILNSTELCNLV